MQWNCPHCGVSLFVTEGTLGTGWSFSRCYKCGGYALIRRIEINVIKVDKAPPGEKIILPEPVKDPIDGLLSQEATEKLSKHIAIKPRPEMKAKFEEKPVQSTTPPPPPPALSRDQKNAFQPNATTFDISAATFPDPLPEEETKTPKTRTLPVGMGIAGILSVISGTYLLFHVQSLWNKAREYAKNDIEVNHRDSSMAAETPPPRKYL